MDAENEEIKVSDSTTFSKSFPWRLVAIVGIFVVIFTILLTKLFFLNKISSQNATNQLTNTNPTPLHTKPFPIRDVISQKMLDLRNQCVQYQSKTSNYLKLPPSDIGLTITHNDFQYIICYGDFNIVYDNIPESLNVLAPFLDTKPPKDSINVFFEYRNKIQVDQDETEELHNPISRSLVQSDRSKNINIYTRFGELGCVVCGIGKGISVALEGVRKIPLSNGAEIVLSMTLNSVVLPQNSQLIDLLYSVGKDKIHKETSPYDSGGPVDRIRESDFDTSLFVKTFNNDFNTPSKNGKSPVQIIKDILSSITIDEKYYLQK